MEDPVLGSAVSGSMRNKCYGDDQNREHCLLVIKHAHFQQQRALAIQLRELQGEDLRSYVRAHLERVDRDTAAFALICQARLEPQSDQRLRPCIRETQGLHRSQSMLHLESIPRQMGADWRPQLGHSPCTSPRWLEHLGSMSPSQVPRKHRDTPWFNRHSLHRKGPLTRLGRNLRDHWPRLRGSWMTWTEVSGRQGLAKGYGMPGSAPCSECNRPLLCASWFRQYSEGLGRCMTRVSPQRPHWQLTGPTQSVETLLCASTFPSDESYGCPGRSTGSRMRPWKSGGLAGFLPLVICGHGLLGTRMMICGLFSQSQTRRGILEGRQY